MEKNKNKFYHSTKNFGKLYDQTKNKMFLRNNEKYFNSWKSSENFAFLALIYYRDYFDI